MNSRRLLRRIIKLFTIATMKVEIIGKEKIPTSGSFIATSNHLGRLDVALIYYALDRDDVILIIAEKYQKSAFFRWLARQLDGIFIDRYHNDFAALRQVLKRLEQGGVFVVAPEGTRSPTAALIEGRSGPAYLASKSGVPVLPVGFTGTEDRVAKKQLKRFRRLKVVGRIGDLYIMPPLPRENRDQVLQQYTDEMMCQIAALLPPEYRGVYAEHPRLRQIVDQS
jgi:1-acyl-sn-glycerol-3-phosphate acyltransferase